MELSLADAFRYRNKVKKVLNRIKTKVERENVAIDPEDLDHINQGFETKSYDGDVSLLLGLMNLLYTVNCAIDKANEGAREILNTINTCSAKIELLNKVTNNVMGCKLYKQDRNPVSGEIKKIALQPLYQKDWQEELVECRKTINLYEEKLSVFNAATLLKFDVPDNLVKVVESA